MRIALLVVLAGCGTDVMPLPGQGSDPGMVGSDVGSDPGMPPMVTDVAGTISADQTWSGIIELTAPVTIAPGVTVTVEPGTTIETPVATVAVSIRGTLDIEGTSGATVLARPATGNTKWAGFVVSAGGTLTAHYLYQTGGGIHLSGTASANIYDSQLFHASGDFLTMGSGNLHVEYSSIGVDVRANDTTHCDMHFTGGAISVTHTDISTSAYGMMFYGGQGADFTYDNWFQNTIDVHTMQGTPVSGDFSNSWFEKGVAPSGVGIVANNLASARVADAGPRP